jgi:hypothetical protein
MYCKNANVRCKTRKSSWLNVYLPLEGKMKNLYVKMAFTGVLLVLVSTGVTADVFSRTFNPNYPVYGFNQIGFNKSPAANALTQTANFATGGDTVVLLDKAETDLKNGKFKIELILRRGLTRVAKLELVLQSDTVTQLNYITRLDFYDFSTTPRRSVEIDWNGREARLDDIIRQFGQILSRFYNPNALGA